MADKEETTTTEPQQNASGVEAATPTEVTPVVANPAGSASPAVENPANSPTLNDVEQSSEDRLAAARTEALANNAVDRGQTFAGQNSDTEEEIA